MADNTYTAEFIEIFYESLENARNLLINLASVVEAPVKFIYNNYPRLATELIPAYFIASAH